MLRKAQATDERSGTCYQMSSTDVLSPSAVRESHSCKVRERRDSRLGSSECNAADGRFPDRPQGARRIAALTPLQDI